ncbi:hypothetical protein [Sediminivirga luteola]|uniref:hypothetical protein n=1 Tax=Sediminivirga luteola TaxID=1774748 RepID=UPI001F55F381|nr:hypothetical protein [Sediminivirga luteola]MCI2266890.1 hypothetical protein [Sediminivirga luteola]
MGHRSRVRQLTAAGALSALLLVGCSAGQEPDPDLQRTPAAGGEALPAVELEGYRVPGAFAELRFVEAGWDLAPQERGGVFVGASDEGEVLEFSAVGSDGAVLWSAQRPILCTGFALVADEEGRDLAVLTDIASSEEAIAATTATAYDLHTGEEVWGPVEVPGPLQGPGLVFGAAPEGFMGEAGPKTALDPTTGEVIAQEDEENRIIGEYQGLVLTAEGGALVGEDGRTDQQEWSVDEGDLGWEPAGASAAVETDPGAELALVTGPEGASALIDTGSGEVVATDVVDAASDPTAGARVLVGPADVRAVDEDNEEQWAQSTGEETTIEAIGTGLVYLRIGDTLRVHNVFTGDVARAYDPEGTGRLLVPEIITDDGGAVFADESRYLIAAV